VFLLYKGWKQEDIFEKCEDINFKEVWIASLIASIDSLFAGVGFALWSVNQIEVFASVIVITALAVILGVYIGYRLGWEPKKKAYYIGAALLLVSAADVLIRLLTK
ncbi:MAG: manganese efflux pump, partial [Clostridia bacterium]|nr:manganese efflux pump [Clostridia bacterium]